MAKVGQAPIKIENGEVEQHMQALDINQEGGDNQAGEAAEVVVPLDNLEAMTDNSQNQSTAELSQADHRKRLWLGAVFDTLRVAPISAVGCVVTYFFEYKNELSILYNNKIFWWAIVPLMSAPTALTFGVALNDPAREGHGRALGGGIAFALTTIAPLAFLAVHAATGHGDAAMIDFLQFAICGFSAAVVGGIMLCPREFAQLRSPSFTSQTALIAMGASAGIGGAR